MAQPKRTKKSSNRPNSPFWQTLLHALENASNAQKLGTDSPLAAPYLLGNHLQNIQAGASERGQILQTILHRSIVQIDGKNGDRYQQLLAEYYLAGHSVQAVCDSIGLGKTTFHANRKQAISQLEPILINQFQPAIQLERPAAVATPLLGREKESKHCIAAIQSGQSVSITGANGIGKTTFGRHLYHACVQTERFWLTFRIGVNDNLQRMLFAIGHFFAQSGYPTLWQEAVANLDAVGVDLALNILRHAIVQGDQSGRQWLLCFDEIDLLDPTNDASHAEIQRLLEGLSELASVVTIGHRQLFATSAVCPLQTLSSGAIAQIIGTTNLAIDPQQRAHLYEITHGNLHLLNLVLSLYERQTPVDSLLEKLAQTPTMELLLGYILQRLNEVERGLLMALSVYPDYAPLDLWQQADLHLALAQVIDYRIAEVDARGGIQIFPAYRMVIYANLPAEKRAHLHKRAASALSQRGAYTAAAYHHIQAGEPEAAIWLWRTHKQQEINQGCAGQAFALFSTIDPQQLTAEGQQTLALLRAELAHLLGKPDLAINTMQSVLWSTPILAVEANLVDGNVATERSEFGKAEAFYRESLAAAEQLVEARLVQVRRGLGAVAIRQRDMDMALREAQFARFEADNLEGLMHEMQYEYDCAVDLYTRALSVAEALEHTRGIARTSINLARLQMQLGHFAEALQHLERAEPCYQRIGNRIGEVGIKITRALAYNLAGEYDLAIAQLPQLALSQTEWPSGAPILPWQRALVAQNLAEAYLGLGQLDEAERWVRQAIAVEEDDVLADSYRVLGEVMLARGLVDEARQQINLGMEICESMDEPDLYLLGYIWRALAAVEREAQNVGGAQRAAERAKELFQQINLPNEVEKTNQLL